MKKILVFLMLTICVVTASAQVLNFRTTSYTYKENHGYGWTNWAPYESSNLKVTMNLNTDMVTIYSPKTQYYKITSYDGAYTDSDGDKTIKYRFIDQDGDYGTMRLVMRRSGKSEIYIDFANIMWVYSVIRTQ